jgi:histidyl-tRNA synthetase
MNDILPQECGAWQWLEARLRQQLAAHSYQEIRCPVLEQTALFKRSIGDITDIVEKEMYTFEDRNGDSLSLRPEGTAQIVRAVLEHNLSYGHTPRLWSIGPMFRHERPQKGRYRQFYQCSVEAFGLSGPDIDAEQILLSWSILKACGLENDVELNINSLGTAEARVAYRAILVEYLSDHLCSLDEDSHRRLSTNPMRILDSKNPDMQGIIENAPKLNNHLDTESAEHFEQLLSILEAAGCSARLNSRLVRGLDYYSRTVFEWITDELGTQGTVAGGGRYDDLLTQLGSKQPCPAVGFSIGMERLLLLIEKKGLTMPSATDVYVATMGEKATQGVHAIVQQWREQAPELKICLHCGGGSLKSQLKKADKSGARVALILGEDEMTAGSVMMKTLREGGGQETLQQTAVMAAIKALWRK